MFKVLVRQAPRSISKIQRHQASSISTMWPSFLNPKSSPAPDKKHKYAEVDPVLLARIHLSLSGSFESLEDELSALENRLKKRGVDCSSDMRYISSKLSRVREKATATGYVRLRLRSALRDLDEWEREEKNRDKMWEGLYKNSD
ncbi:hypothetical protein CONLIGDRAFT_630236 [Coniochaeta ligniaria NRRL 30616]|uniref:Uncharacterized protein n=1 Tax=Coniochaeta ligniaria NRRL 30616 TaxID=1408157 RepID=A0A1J7JT67_9PEZI|nr:hypothetical protein CONLIGDRAFT_630236 [Coniochaeta ligniaria NRRL 30616]